MKNVSFAKKKKNVFIEREALYSVTMQNFMEAI